jgi:hypothetical protein
MNSAVTADLRSAAGDFGVRGHVRAFKAATRRRTPKRLVQIVWKRSRIPHEGDSFIIELR